MPSDERTPADDQASDGPLVLVLAAGRGRRVGGPKALLDLAGRSALQRVLEAFRGAGLADLRVSLPADLLEAAARVADLSRLMVVPIADPDAGGQLASIQAALAAGPLPAAGFILHPVDVALVGVDDVTALLAAVAARPAGRALVVPSVDGRRAHPAWFEASLAAEFAALPPGQPAHRVVRRDLGRVEHVVVDAPWLLRDIDTPADLAWARAHCAARR